MISAGFDGRGKKRNSQRIDGSSLLVLSSAVASKVPRNGFRRDIWLLSIDQEHYPSFLPLKMDVERILRGRRMRKGSIYQKEEWGLVKKVLGS